MFFVSKKKYDTLNGRCCSLEDCYKTVSEIAKEALNANCRIIDHWKACLKENERLRAEIIALKAAKEESCQDDQQKLDLQ